MLRHWRIERQLVPNTVNGGTQPIAASAWQRAAMQRLLPVATEASMRAVGQLAVIRPTPIVRGRGPLKSVKPTSAVCEPTKTKVDGTAAHTTGELGLPTCCGHQWARFIALKLSVNARAKLSVACGPELTEMLHPRRPTAISVFVDIYGEAWGGLSTIIRCLR